MSSKKLFLSLLLAGTVFAAAHTHPLAEEKKPDTGDYVILNVNGDDIHKSEVVAIWSGLFPGESAPAFDGFDEKVRQNVLRGVVSEHLIYREAVNSGQVDQAEIDRKLEKIRQQLVTKAFLKQKAESDVSEETLRAAYNRKLKEYDGKQEIHARHILVKDKSDAKRLRSELKGGKSFEKLAAEASIDKASAVRGGDLGWFTEEKMVPPFAEVAFALDKGEISKPVQTKFGWHIIQVEDKRDVQVPDFQDVKMHLREEVKADTLKEYINRLIDTANIKYYDEKGKELELTRTPDKAESEG